MGALTLFVVGGLVVLAVAGTMTSVARAPSNLQRPLALLATDLGMEPPEPGSVMLAGPVQGVQVEIKADVGSHEVPAWVEVRVPLRRWLPANLSISAEGVVPSFDLKTGDPSFDKLTKLTGPPDVLLSLLGHEERASLVLLVGLQRFKVATGGLVAQLPRLETERSKVGETVRQLAQLARRLDARPSQVEKGLMMVIQQDPHELVRRHAAELLLGHHAGTDAAAGLPAVLMNDPARGLRLMGAGFATRTDPKAKQVWREALASDDPLERLPAARGLAACGDRAVVTSLYAALPEPDGNVAVEIADGFGRLAHPDSEPGLRRLLKHPGIAVRVAAARGLLHRGDVGSVEALVDASRAAPIAVRRACKAAITAIQERIPEGGRGRLALADEEDAAGRLSQARWGELQVVDESDNQSDD